MPTPDISNLSVAELQALMAQAQTLAAQKALQEQAERDLAQLTVNSAVATLTGLLGPENAEPGTDSIRAVLAFGTDAIKANVQEAVPLILEGLRILTETTLALARVQQDIPETPSA